MPKDRKKLEVDHPDWMGITIKVISGILSVIVFVAWYFGQMSIKSKEDVIRIDGDLIYMKGAVKNAIETLESSQTSKLDNEIQRSMVEDRDIRKDVEENKQTLKRVLEYAIRQDEAKKYLHKE